MGKLSKLIYSEIKNNVSIFKHDFYLANFILYFSRIINDFALKFDCLDTCIVFSDVEYNITVTGVIK